MIFKINNFEKAETRVQEIRADYDNRFIDQDLVEKIKRIHWGNDKILLFTGNYLQAKEFYLILLIIPFVLKKVSGFKICFCRIRSIQERRRKSVNLFSKRKPGLLKL